MTAGYSGVPLVRKLGFKPGMRVHYAHAPEAFPGLVGELPGGVNVLRRPAGDLDLVMLFATERSVLARELQTLQPKLTGAG